MARLHLKNFLKTGRRKKEGREGRREKGRKGGREGKREGRDKKKPEKFIMKPIIFNF
jgi:hypothetical protein